MSIENILFRCGGGGNSKLKVASLTVTTQPTKLNYVQYEKLNLAGIQVMATFEDGVTANVTSAITTIPSITDLLSAVGTNTITVEWGGAETSFNVSVEECTGISVFKAPDKIYYEPDDELDLTGLVIRGTSATMTADLTNSCTFNPPAGTVLSEEGTITVTATVGVFTTSFNVTVTSAETLYQQVRNAISPVSEDLWLAFVQAGCIAMVINSGDQSAFLGKEITINNSNFPYPWQIVDFNFASSGNTCELLLEDAVAEMYYTSNSADPRDYYSSNVRNYLLNDAYPNFSEAVKLLLKPFSETTGLSSNNDRIIIPSAPEISSRDSRMSYYSYQKMLAGIQSGAVSKTTKRFSRRYWTTTYNTSYNNLVYSISTGGSATSLGYNQSDVYVRPKIRFGTSE